MKYLEQCSQKTNIDNKINTINTIYTNSIKSDRTCENEKNPRIAVVKISKTKDLKEL